MSVTRSGSELSLSELDCEWDDTPEAQECCDDLKPRSLVGPEETNVRKSEPPESSTYITPKSAEDRSDSGPVTAAFHTSMASNLEKDYLSGSPPTYASVMSEQGSSSAHPTNPSMSGAGSRAVSTQADRSVISPPYPTNRSSYTGTRPKEPQRQAPARGSPQAAPAQNLPETKKVRPTPATTSTDKVLKPAGLKVDLSSRKSGRSKARGSATPSQTSNIADNSNSSNMLISGSRNGHFTSDSSDSSSSSLDSNPAVHNSRKTSTKSSISEFGDSNVERVITDSNTHVICTKGSKGTTSYTINSNGVNTITLNNNINIGFNPQSSSTRVSKNSPRRSSSNLSKIQIPAKGSTRRISPEDIEILSRELGDAWMRVGLSIGVKKGDLENIKFKHEQSRDQREMTRLMLSSWVARFGHNAKINYIIAALTDKEFGLHEVAAALPVD